jgi:nitrogen fixation protein NifX
MKVAFTSSDGKSIDQHFGMASEYWIWEVERERAELVGRVTPLLGDGDEEDRTAARANAVEGCAIVYTVQIGGPAAAKLVARQIHPMKTGGVVEIAEAIAKLQGVLDRPPPWLRKRLGGSGAAAL